MIIILDCGAWLGKKQKGEQKISAELADEGVDLLHKFEPDLLLFDDREALRQNRNVHVEEVHIDHVLLDLTPMQSSAE